MQQHSHPPIAIDWDAEFGRLLAPTPRDRIARRAACNVAAWRRVRLLAATRTRSEWAA